MYSVRVPYIDNQHQKLVRIINDFYDTLKDTESNSSMFQILNDLLHYAELHFKDEEEIMQLVGYPEDKFLEHKEEHEKIIEQIYKLNDQLAQGDEKSTFSLEEFLNNWIIKHILEVDKEYQPYMTRYRLEKPKQIMDSNFFTRI